MKNSLQRTKLTDNRYFYEDQVFRFKKSGRLCFGLVVETDDDYDADNEDDYDDIPKKGEVRVAWFPDGEEQILKESKLGLADRTIMPGDVLRRLDAEKDAQFCYCRNVKLLVDVRVIGSKHVIKNVPTERMIPPLPWQLDNTVVFGSWVGTITEIVEKAVLKAKNGACCLIDSEHFHMFRSSKEEAVGNENLRFTAIFRGNTVIGRLPSLNYITLLTPDIALPFNSEGKSINAKYTVEAHFVEAVHVQWQCKGSSHEPQKSKVQPKLVISGKDLDRLKIMNIYDSCMTQLFDRAFLNYKENDELVSNAEWEREQIGKYKEILKAQKALWKKISIVNNLVIQQQQGKRTAKSSNPNCPVHKKLNSKPKVKVSKASQNAEEAKDSDWMSDTEGSECKCPVNSNISKKRAKIPPASSSSSLNRTYPVTCLSIPQGLDKRFNGHKKTKLVYKQKYEPLHLVAGQEYPVEVLSVRSVGTVVWQDGTIEENVQSTDLYPIHYVDEHELFPGDFVTKVENTIDSYRDYGVVQTVNHKGRTVYVKWFRTYASSDDCNPIFIGENELSVYDLKDHPDFNFGPGTMVIRVANFDGERSNETAGQVLESYIDGQVKVNWVDGQISLCWPQDLYVVKQLQDEEIELESNEDDDELEYEDIKTELKFDVHENDISSASSWETQTDTSDNEHSVSKKVKSSKSDVIQHFERALSSIEFAKSKLGKQPDLQSPSVKRKILMVYQQCRTLDLNLRTEFFHEDNMAVAVGVLRKSREAITDMRESGTQTATQSPEKLSSTLPADAQMFSMPFKDSSIVANDEDTDCLLKEAGTQTPSDHDYAKNPYMFMPLNSSDITSDMDDVVHRIEEVLDATKNFKAQIPVEGEIFLKDDSGNFSRIEGSSNSDQSFVDGSPIKTTNSTNSCNITETTSFGDDPYPDIKAISLCNILETQLFACMEFVQNNVTDSIKKTVEYIKKDDKIEFTKEGTKHENEKEKQVKWEVNSNVKEGETTLVVTNTLNVDKEHPLTLLQTDASAKTEPGEEHFKIISTAPHQHKYYSSKFHPYNPKQYFKAIENEYRLLKSSLPPGVFVRGYEDRIDLLSVMIIGPKDTPYEDGLFFFDVQLGPSYPTNPPLFTYLSFCADRLNPNLYEDGKVCVSLLGTWSGRGTEVWGKKSTLLQVIVSIQGLILVAEPYYNEAGYEKQKGSAQGLQNSRMYNEMAIIKLVQTTIQIITKPPIIFRDEVFEHWRVYGQDFYKRILGWVQLSKEEEEEESNYGSNIDIHYPDFPLLPASRGFCLALNALLEALKTKIKELNSTNDQSPSSSSVLSPMPQLE